MSLTLFCTSLSFVSFSSLSLLLFCSSSSAAADDRRSKVFFDVQIGNGDKKRITFELANDITPKVSMSSTQTAPHCVIVQGTSAG